MMEGDCGACCGKTIGNPSDLGILYSLYKKIDLENLECLNEEVGGSGKTVFKAFEERYSRENFVQSDSEVDLLFNIPFTGNVKIKSMRVIGDADDTQPRTVKIYKNRPKMAINDVPIKSDQEIDLANENDDEIEYSLRVPIFSGVHHLSLYFPSNYGAEKTRINYIGLRGEFTERHHHGVTICDYEVRPNIEGNRNGIFESTGYLV